MSRFLCVYCAASRPSANGTGSDVRCCGEVGHVEPDEPTAAPAPACPCCGGPLGLLGFLGRLAWLSCRDCGHETYAPREELPEADLDEVIE